MIRNPRGAPPLGIDLPPQQMQPFQWMGNIPDPPDMGSESSGGMEQLAGAIGSHYANRPPPMPPMQPSQPGNPIAPQPYNPGGMMNPGGLNPIAPQAPGFSGGANPLMKGAPLGGRPPIRFPNQMQMGQLKGALG